MMTRLRDLYVQVMVLCTGAVVMALEFVGARLLAPRWGDALPVWGATIATVLGAMAVGYSVGGRLADRRPSLAPVQLLLGAGAVIVAITALIAEDALDALRELTAEPRVGALIGSVIVCAPAAMLLAALSPLALRLRTDELTQAGRRAGDLYALGTVGSIAGSLASTFVLIDLLGLTRLLLVLAATLALLGAGAAALQARRLTLGALTVLAATALGLASAAGSNAVGDIARDGGKVRASVDSPYHRIVVTDHPGRLRHLNFNDLTQSAVDLDHPDRPQLAYMQSAARTLCAGPVRRVLLLGVAAGSYVRLVRAVHPRAQIVGVDIDRQVLDVARRWMQLPDGPAARYVVADGRQALSAQPDRTFDVIYLDAYNAQHIPAHLATSQFYALAARKLTPGGTLAANVIARPRSPLAGALARTLGEHLPQLTVLDAQPAAPAGRERNLLMISSPRAPDRRCLRRAERQLGLPAGRLDLRDVSGPPGALLTDDHAPLRRLRER